ncbi:MAG: M6 family metalloprotease domain-containing protein, partial [bacterium]|nr:M6 family metalloprotease domain-containing protein [bacterium]
MKARLLSRLMMTLAILGAATCALSMPPHPDLMNRIRSGEAAVPFFLRHEQEIRSAGVNAPSELRTIERLRRRALDENVNLIAILVDFSDHTSDVSPAFFDTLLYGSQIGTLHDYYDECSYGSLTLTTVHFPSALGWRRAPQTYDYYVDGQNGFGTYPHNAQRLTQDAVQAVDSVVDFSHYDNDGDGYVEGLFIIHSGPGAEFTGNNNDIWSHAWSVRTPIYTDGVTISPYSMEPEFWQWNGDMTCGVFAHEMGHAVFGVPDFYDYGGDSQGLGSWSLMAGGSWGGDLGDSPAHPDGYSLTDMGFVTPVNVTEYQMQAAIPAIQTEPVIFRLWTDGMMGNEYFLVENRQQIGYDTPLPGNGLLIYHVDEFVSGNDDQWFPGHTGSGHYQVAIEQADGLWELEQDLSSGDPGDPYPGTTNNTTFSGSSTPDSRDYDGNYTYVGVRNISPSSAVMHADLVVSPGPGNPVLVTLPDTTG